MRIPFRLAATLALAILAAGCRGDAPAETTAAPAAAADPVAAAQAWRDKHESDYRRDWVSIAGLHMLQPGANTVGSAESNAIVIPSTPERLGTFTLNGDTVSFAPAPGADVTIKGAAVTTRTDLRDDSAREYEELVTGDVRLVIHKSGDKFALRVRNPKGPLATGFLGFTWFPIDPAYRVTGKFIKDAEPTKVKVVNTYGDVDEYSTEGVISFTLQGQALTIRPFTTRPNRFYIVFKDASSGDETYGVARFLYADLLEDGTTVLDFNVAYNPPCAFNPYTTCPIPLRENNLPVKVLAGEKAYPVHVPTASGQ